MGQYEKHSIDTFESMAALATSLSSSARTRFFSDLPDMLSFAAGVRDLALASPKVEVLGIEVSWSDGPRPEDRRHFVVNTAPA